MSVSLHLPIPAAGVWTWLIEEHHRDVRPQREKGAIGFGTSYSIPRLAAAAFVSHVNSAADDSRGIRRTPVPFHSCWGRPMLSFVFHLSFFTPIKNTTVMLSKHLENDVGSRSAANSSLESELGPILDIVRRRTRRRRRRRRDFSIPRQHRARQRAETRPQVSFTLLGRRIQFLKYPR